MPVNMIAVDMDGTFLDDNKTYDRPRFLAQYQQLKARGIRFVVASGNQYYQLISFFPEIAAEIAFVAENGAWVVDGTEDVFHAQLPAESARKVLARLRDFPQLEIIVCGKKQAWTLRHYQPEFQAVAARYYHRLTLVDNFTSVDDTILKFALNVSQQHQSQTHAQLCKAMDGLMTPVSSGHGSIDLIIPSVHKAHGLQLLQQRWQISDAEIMAFGDSGNDLEMLRHAGFSFAMGNGVPAVKAAARYSAPDNNHHGVLAVIDQLLHHQPPFN